MMKFVRVFKCKRCGDIFNDKDNEEFHKVSPYNKMNYEHICKEKDDSEKFRQHGFGEQIGFDMWEEE